MAESNQTPNGALRFKVLIEKIKNDFRREYSKNQIKNFWYLWQKKRNQEVKDFLQVPFYPGPLKIPYIF